MLVLVQAEQARLMAIVAEALWSSPKLSWEIVRYAVIHADEPLVSRILLRKLPVRMVNPDLSSRDRA